MSREDKYRYILSCLKHESPKKVDNALGIVRSQLLKEKGGVEKLCRLGIMSELLRLARDCNFTEVARLNVLLSLLSNMCMEKCARKAVVAITSSISTLVEILEETEAESVKNRSCRTLANLALDSSACDRIMATDGVELVVQFFKTTQDKECKKTCCRALRLFGYLEKHRKKIVDDGGIFPVASLLKEEDEELRDCGLRSLSELSTNCSIGCANQIQNTGAVEKLVALVREQDSASKQFGFAKKTLMNLMEQPNARPSVGNAGGIALFLTLMKLESLPRKKIPMLNALCLFCRESVNRIRIREQGILEILTSSLLDDELMVLHGRIISSLVCFIYDEPSLNLLLSKGLIPILLKHLQSSAGFVSSLNPTLRDSIYSRFHVDNSSAKADMPQTRSDIIPGQSPALKDCLYDVTEANDCVSKREIQSPENSEAPGKRRRIAFEDTVVVFPENPFCNKERDESVDKLSNERLVPNIDSVTVADEVFVHPSQKDGAKDEIGVAYSKDASDSSKTIDHQSAQETHSRSHVYSLDSPTYEAQYEEWSSYNFKSSVKCKQSFSPDRWSQRSTSPSKLSVMSSPSYPETYSPLSVTSYYSPDYLPQYSPLNTTFSSPASSPGFVCSDISSPPRCSSPSEMSESNEVSSAGVGIDVDMWEYSSDDQSVDAGNLLLNSAADAGNTPSSSTDAYDPPNPATDADNPPLCSATDAGNPLCSATDAGTCNPPLWPATNAGNPPLCSTTNAGNPLWPATNAGNPPLCSTTNAGNPPLWPATDADNPPLCSDTNAGNPTLCSATDAGNPPSSATDADNPPLCFATDAGNPLCSAKDACNPLQSSATNACNPPCSATDARNPLFSAKDAGSSNPPSSDPAAGNSLISIEKDGNPISVSIADDANPPLISAAKDVKFLSSRAIETIKEGLPETSQTLALVSEVLTSDTSSEGNNKVSTIQSKGATTSSTSKKNLVSSTATNKKTKLCKTTEENILIFLSRVSQMCDPSKYLVTDECIACLLDYISLSEKPNARAGRILRRVVQNPHCLESLLDVLMPIVVLDKLHGRQFELVVSLDETITEEGNFGLADAQSPTKSVLSEKENTEEQTSIIGKEIGATLLQDLSFVVESSYGRGTVAHILKRRSEAQKMRCVLCLPYLCRSIPSQQKTLFHDGALRLLLDFLQTEPMMDIHQIAIEGLHYLCGNSGVKLDLPDHKPPFPSDLSATARSLIFSAENGQYGKLCGSTECIYIAVLNSHDLTFVLEGGRKCTANREILAAVCPVFKAMLGGDYTESRQNEINIQQVSPAVFDFLLHFLHGCRSTCPVVFRVTEAECPLDHFLDVLALTDRYLLSNLKNYLETVAKQEYLSMSTVVDMYHFSTVNNCDTLAKDCLRHLFKENLPDDERLQYVEELLSHGDIQSTCEHLYQVLRSHTFGTRF